MDKIITNWDWEKEEMILVVLSVNEEKRKAITTILLIPFLLSWLGCGIFPNPNHWITNSDRGLLLPSLY